jgi:cytochrome d ubiquinol oxidase subunit II
MELATVWFLLWGLLWAVYFITDGWDLGIGTLYPFLGRNETDKRIMINVVGPLWDGNEVWLLTAGGVTFAAFPLTYAVLFSSFYTPLMLLLFALIFRGVSFEYRGKSENKTWVKFWDWCIFLGSMLPAILLGVAFANIFRGVPIDQDGVFKGNLLTFLNPYGLLGGLVFLSFFITHGATMLAFKTEGGLHQRAAKVANQAWYAYLITAVLCLGFSAVATNLYANYLAQPALFLIIALAVAGVLGIKFFLIKQDYFKAWVSSAVSILGVTFFGIVGLHPVMLPSSLDPAYSVTIQKAASSPLTLTIMLVLALIFVPIVIGYQIWANLLFKEAVTEKHLEEDEAY